MSIPTNNYKFALLISQSTCIKSSRVLLSLFFSFFYLLFLKLNLFFFDCLFLPKFLFFCFKGSGLACGSGSKPALIFEGILSFISFSIFIKYSFSSLHTNEIAFPFAPALPVLPILCT